MNKKLILLILFFGITNFQLNAEMNIAYIDMDIILNKSNPGLKIIKTIDKIKNKSEKMMLKIENDLKKKENVLMTQKNILNKNDFDDKLIKFRSEVNKYKIKKQNESKFVRDNYVKMNSALIKNIQPLLVDYVKSKDITFLLQKKNIILGASEFDITDDVIKIINKNIKVIK
tara:strand:- start:4498 stop:5013 length:516 start_codon:yes stop_codon:yes gene_type:complete